MEDLREKIEKQLKLLEKDIKENKDKEEIANKRKELDKLLNEYNDKFE